MSDNFLANLSQDARDAYFTGLNVTRDTQQAFVSDTGDTMTGVLKVPGIAATSTASLYGTQIYTDIATSEAAIVSKQVIGGATVAPMRFVQSTASGAFLSFSGVFISSASYGGLANTNAFVIPVYHESQRIWGYLGAQKALV